MIILGELMHRLRFRPSYSDNTFSHTLSLSKDSVWPKVVSLYEGRILSPGISLLFSCNEQMTVSHRNTRGVKPDLGAVPLSNYGKRFVLALARFICPIYIKINT